MAGSNFVNFSRQVVIFYLGMCLLPLRGLMVCSRKDHIVTAGWDSSLTDFMDAVTVGKTDLYPGQSLAGCQRIHCLAFCGGG
ncbi:hypothetical protein Noc_2898 [Nitrosococcus oceani ATCC 19707]|uniref:Uncharacterized protein n=1 Tax=Nitrosococcus oceani (strain ATCC 19707 / BCRC 17464 / JCM 30415 / NCIMB 11848 / C-107) TaxID=323261 RepID=Q3J752_NITOC|nr:hypothetical protein Noc_2898 [Nitrosococcus oceani ATCC 19707]EDZ66628.1 hypothetical protein NOC27_3308 [Nitrosococcus oceani AFC27]